MSSEVFITNSIYHPRRYKQTKETEVLATNINPLITELDEKQFERKKQKPTRDNIYYDIIFNKGTLGEQIRNTSGSIKQFDRNTPGPPVYKLIFLEGGYSSILNFSHSKKINTADQIVERRAFCIRLHNVLSKIKMGFVSLQTSFGENSKRL